MAFFPNFLKERHRLITSCRTPFPPSHTVEEILQIRRQNNDLWEPHLFLNEYDEPSNGVVNDALYEICTNKELRKVLGWISKRILIAFGIDNYLSLNVYIRIGTSMLNKLEQDKIISKELNMAYHDNLVRNLADLLSCTNEESLPF